MQSTSPKKPSPLSFGSPRSSPFDRVSSPTYPPLSTLNTTPSKANLRARSPNGASSSPAQSQHQSSPQPHRATSPSIMRERAMAPIPSPTSSPTIRPLQFQPYTASVHDPLARIPPPLLHDLRESFAALDTSSAGTVTAADVLDAHKTLGVDASSAELASYFPRGGEMNMNLPTYLNTLAGMLGGLSDAHELAAAFAAFDVDDSGQVDVEVLKGALLEVNGLGSREIDGVMDGFKGRRVLSKGMERSGMGIGMGAGGKRGEVFRYQDFIAGISGGASAGKAQAEVVKA